MKVFLTGEKQVGKSTIIQRYIKEHDAYTYSGFFTRLSDDKSCVYLYPLRKDIKPCIVAKRFGEKMKAIDGAFDNIDDNIFDGKCDILILDELGFTEERELKFQKKVLNAVKTAKNVMGVIRNDAYFWKKNISLIPETCILEVTKDNRDGIQVK